MSDAEVSRDLLSESTDAWDCAHTGTMAMEMAMATPRKATRQEFFDIPAIGPYLFAGLLWLGVTRREQDTDGSGR